MRYDGYQAPIWVSLVFARDRQSLLRRSGVEITRDSLTELLRDPARHTHSFHQPKKNPSVSRRVEHRDRFARLRNLSRMFGARRWKVKRFSRDPSAKRSDASVTFASRDPSANFPLLPATGTIALSRSQQGIMFLGSLFKWRASTVSDGVDRGLKGSVTRMGDGVGKEAYTRDELYLDIPTRYTRDATLTTREQQLAAFRIRGWFAPRRRLSRDTSLPSNLRPPTLAKFVPPPRFSSICSLLARRTISPPGKGGFPSLARFSVALPPSWSACCLSPALRPSSPPLLFVPLCSFLHRARRKPRQREVEVSPSNKFIFPRRAVIGPAPFFAPFFACIKSICPCTFKSPRRTGPACRLDFPSLGRGLAGRGLPHEIFPRKRQVAYRAMPTMFRAAQTSAAAKCSFAGAAIRAEQRERHCGARCDSFRPQNLPDTS